MLPKFSIDESRRTITSSSAIRFAPCARFTLMIAGSNCGVSPTARASEKRSESSTGRWSSTLAAKMQRTNNKVISVRK